ncbi:MAG: hypothetical protein L0Y56_18125, partial [Nitrospira sp.]|nr:hypothetical protein [Nitrospira sp.]
MVAKYDQMRAQNRITNEEVACLQDEKNAAIRIQSQLQEKMREALEKGQGLFRGVSKDAADLGKNLGEIFKKFLDFAVPDLYPKLGMAARPLKGTEAEEILKVANLTALPQVFYGGEQGLNLVIKEGSRFVPNPGADVAKEVLDYLHREHAYGNKETRTGKALETHFGGLGYGWDPDILRLILAVLFRAGSIEVSHGGQRFDSYQNPQSRLPFTKIPTFRSALFTPVKPLDLKTLTQAVKSYEELTGETVDVEKNAIAEAFKKLVEEELKLLLPLQAQAKAHGLPILDQIEEFRASLHTVQVGAADDCVRILAGEGKSLKETRDRIRKIREATTDHTLTMLRSARRAIKDQWPIVASYKPLLTETAERLQRD